MFAQLKYALLSMALVIQTTKSATGDEIFVIDDTHTSVVFSVSHFGYSYTYGTFNQAKGGFVLDRENPKNSQFQLIINASSVDTNNQKRDDHLKGPGFFNVKQFEVITFQSSSVSIEKSEDGEVYNLHGKLTMHGVTRDVTLPAKKLGEGEGPRGAFRSGFHCQTELKRSEYGMTKMLPKIGDKIGIIVSIEGVRQDAPPAKK